MLDPQRCKTGCSCLIQCARTGSPVSGFPARLTLNSVSDFSKAMMDGKTSDHTYSETVIQLLSSEARSSDVPMGGPGQTL